MDINWKKFSEEKPDFDVDIFIYVEGGFTQAVNSEAYGLQTKHFPDHGCGCCAECLDGEIYWTYDLPNKPE